MTTLGHLGSGAAAPSAVPSPPDFVTKRWAPGENAGGPKPGRAGHGVDRLMGSLWGKAPTWYAVRWGVGHAGVPDSQGQTVKCY